MSARLVGWFPAVGRIDVPLGKSAFAAVGGTVPEVLGLCERIVDRDGQHWLQVSPGAAEVRVNGIARREGPLRHLDVITLADGTNLVFLKSGSITLPAAPVRVSLEWVDGPAAGLSQTLAPGEVTFGRGNDAKVRLDRQGISRVHARLIITANRVSLEDLGASNGTCVNGRPITGVVALHDGDEFDLAGVQKFKIRGGPVRDRAADVVLESIAPQAAATPEDGRDQTRYMPPHDVADLAPPVFTQFESSSSVDRAAAARSGPRDDGTVFAPMDAAVPPQFEDVGSGAERGAGSRVDATTFFDRATPDSPPPQLMPVRRLAGVRLSGSVGSFTARAGRTVIGRDHDAGICIDHRQVSRTHAALTVAGTVATVEDLASANRTWVNGRVITSACALADGDRVAFGKLEFTVNLVDEGNA